MQRLMGYCIALVLLAGCGSAPPSWFLGSESAKQHGARFYGVGTGKSFESAKQSAVDDLAQSVQTQVRSSTHIHNAQHNDKLTTTLSQHIQLDSASLSLQNLQITNKAYKHGTYYVQVGISKEHLLAPLRAQLQETLAPAKHLSSTDPSCLSLRDFGALESSLRRANAIMPILSALQAPTPKLFSQLLTLYDHAPKPMLNVAYYGLSAAQSSVLSAEISKLATITKHKAPLLSISATSTKNAKGASITLQITLLDCAQRAIFQASIQESQASYDYALKRAGIVLYKKLRAFMQGEDGFPAI